MHGLPNGATHQHCPIHERDNTGWRISLEVKILLMLRSNPGDRFLKHPGKVLRHPATRAPSPRLGFDDEPWDDECDYDKRWDDECDDRVAIDEVRDGVL